MDVCSISSETKYPHLKALVRITLLKVPSIPSKSASSFLPVHRAVDCLRFYDTSPLVTHLFTLANILRVFLPLSEPRNCGAAMQSQAHAQQKAVCLLKLSFKQFGMSLNRSAHSPSRIITTFIDDHC